MNTYIEEHTEQRLREIRREAAMDTIAADDYARCTHSRYHGNHPLLASCACPEPSLSNRERVVNGKVVRKPQSVTHGIYDERGFLVTEVGCCSPDFHMRRLVLNELIDWREGSTPHPEAVEAGWDAMLRATDTYDPKYPFWPYARDYFVREAFAEVYKRRRYTISHSNDKTYILNSNADPSVLKRGLQGGLGAYDGSKFAALRDDEADHFHRLDLPDDWERGWDSLTDRQRQVLEMVKEGHSQNEIARRLGIDKAAVSRHLAKARDRWTAAL